MLSFSLHYVSFSFLMQQYILCNCITSLQFTVLKFYIHYGSKIEIILLLTIAWWYISHLLVILIRCKI